ncbi:hypothetical protein [Ruegeria sp.]|uniref:hypothetical protein n=1 Tax=Ruegeria sp. TaxID=1879320 RepID=UPI002313F4A5|nr:hypothetical protein [Ruegeria sp.]MDA7965940.1 hypothetical protein [Ruegeria sp.]
MLWLHLGMPKTGTTALQAFVRNNRSMLDQAGLRYMETGRRNLDGTGRLRISQNMIAFYMNQTKQPMQPYREAMGQEYLAHQDKTCLVSSEMFYTIDLPRLAQAFADIPPDRMRIAFYIRRYSDFFEAEFKQRAKNGRLPGNGSDYIKTRLASIEANPDRHSYSGATARIRAAFPGVEVVPMLYDRSEMVGGNVVDDFLSRIGVDLPDGVTSDLPSNPSQSRAASEAFGIVGRALGRRHSRQLRRMTPDDPVMVRRNDVLEPPERVWLDDYLSQQDEAFRQEFFPDRTPLFPKVELSEEEQQFRRDSEREYHALQQATEIVFRLALDSIELTQS